MPKSSPRLGKGLSALIGPRVATPFHSTLALTGSPHAPTPETPHSPALRQIPLESLSPNPRQPRASIDQAGLEHLAASIRVHGVLQPLLVRRTGAERYELVAGERRWRAAEIAGLKTVPAIVVDLTESQSLEAALVENLQREDLAPLERATAYQQLVDMLGSSIDAVAERLGESRANVSNYLRLLKLSPEVQSLLASGELAMGQARAIAGISDPKRQLAVARLAVRRRLSVRQVEALSRNGGEVTARESTSKRAADAHLADVAEALSKALGLKVSLHPGKRKNSGRIVIRYNSLEEFDRLAEAICGRPLLE